MHHPLPKNGAALLSSGITILQIGPGNASRELRIAARVHGEPGYFFKEIADADWKWCHNSSVKVPDVLPLVLDSPPSTTTGPTSHPVDVVLAPFGSISAFSTKAVSSWLTLKDGGASPPILIYRRVNIVAKAMYSLGESWDICFALHDNRVNDDQKLDIIASVRKLIFSTLRHEAGWSFLRRLQIVHAEHHENWWELCCAPWREKFRFYKQYK